MTRAAVSVREAQRIVLGALTPQPSLRIPLVDAVGRILAADVVASLPLPPWTNSAMDGYAVHAADVRGATPSHPVVLDVVATAAAGSDAPMPLVRGAAVRIFTGGRVPDGADTIIRQEDTDRGSMRVVITSDRDARMHVRREGNDLARGALVLRAGTLIGPRQVALLAALGDAQPLCIRAPRVAVLSTGDEVVSLDRVEAIRSGAKLADVNGPALCALVNEAGGVAEHLGIARDAVDDIVARVRGADDCDAIITAGGVSVGEHDHLHRVMEVLGARELVSRVRVRPGGPTAFALLPDGRPWLALPGNPVSAIVTFELFGRPMIRAMAGDPAPLAHTIEVILAEDVRADAVLDLYLRVVLVRGENGAAPTARITGVQGSGMLSGIAWADALAIIPAGTGLVPVHTRVEAIALRAH